MENEVEVKIFPTKVWIENDLLGGRHVMVQHQDGQSDPFTYCTFNYDYAYTSNAQINQDAEKMAIRLGASHPVEQKMRPMK